MRILRKKRILEKFVITGHLKILGMASKKASGAPRTQGEIARATWELSNNVMEVSASEDIYKYNCEQQRSMLSAKPWEKDPHFFKVRHIFRTNASFIRWLGR